MPGAVVVVQVPDIVGRAAEARQGAPGAHHTVLPPAQVQGPLCCERSGPCENAHTGLIETHSEPGCSGSPSEVV